MDKVRCFACKGRRVVTKLGGITGDCDLCKGSGKVDKTVNDEHKPMSIVAVIQEPIAISPLSEDVSIIKQVSECVETKVDRVEKKEEQKAVADIKVDRRKAIYKRKKA